MLIIVSFFKYYYGTAIIFDSMWRATNKYNNNSGSYLNYYNIITSYLNYFIYDDYSSGGYKIVNDIIIPWSDYDEHNIGDVTGLMPINYLSKLEFDYVYSNDVSVFDLNDNIYWKLIFNSSDYYVLQYPRKIYDGTISRNDTAGWKNQPDNSSIVWADDNYMGTTLLNRLNIFFIRFKDQLTQYNLRNNISSYVDFVYNQNMLIAKHLLYNGISNDDGFYAHGYNALNDEHSCCSWLRANAWVLLSKVEALKMYDILIDSEYNNINYTKQKNDILLLYQNQMNKMASFQDKNTGLFHQVLNDSSTYLELSGSNAMFQSMIFGYLNKYLPTNIYDMTQWNDMINKTWNDGLSKYINPNNDGRFENSCIGCGIENSAEIYNERGTEYCQSGDPGGPGFVISSLVAYQDYLDSFM